MLEYRNVVKRYGGVVAVDGISVKFDAGRINALLGPNGSGKSTMMKMALGVVRPDSGEVLVDGMNPISDALKVRRVVGYAPEEIILYESLTLTELFSFLREVYGIPREEAEQRIRFLAKLFKMEENMNKLIGELSHGNKRKILVASALFHNPKVLILDEPFSGLDPEVGRVLKEMMRKYANEGNTVIFSTHVLEIAEAVADEVTIVYKGKLVAKGSTDELRNKVRAADLESIFMKVTGLESDLKELLDTLWGA